MSNWHIHKVVWKEKIVSVKLDDMTALRFFAKTFNFHSNSLYPGVLNLMSTSKFNAGNNPVIA